MNKSAIFSACLLVASFAQADTLLVGNKAKNTLSFVDLATGKVVKVLPTGRGPHEVDVSPDGRLAIVADYGTGPLPGNTLTLVNVEQAEVIGKIDLGGNTRPHGIVWLPDGEHVAVTTEGAGTLTVVNVNERRVAYTLPTRQSGSHMLAVNGVGSTAFVANISSGSVTSLELKPGAEPQNLPTGEGAEGVAVTLDGKEVWVSNREADTVTVLNAETLEVITQLPTGDFPIRAEMTPDGKYALVTNADSGDLSVYDVKDKREIKRVELDVKGGKGASIFGDAFASSSVPIGIQPHPEKNLIYIAHANGDVISEVSTETWEIVRIIDAGPEPDGMAYTSISPKTK